MNPGVILRSALCAKVCDGALGIFAVDLVPLPKSTNEFKNSEDLESLTLNPLFISSVEVPLLLKMFIPFKTLID